MRKLNIKFVNVNSSLWRYGAIVIFFHLFFELLWNLSHLITSLPWWYGHDWSLKKTWYYLNFDQKIPFIVHFIWFYLSSWFFIFPIFGWFIFLNRFIKKNKQNSLLTSSIIQDTNHVLLTILVSELLFFFVWIIFPLNSTISGRWFDEEISPFYSKLFSLLLSSGLSNGSLEKNANTTNTLPTAHFLPQITLLLLIHNFRRFYTNTKIRIIFYSLSLTTLGTIASTFFLKQHYFIDWIFTLLFLFIIKKIISRKNSYY